MGSIDLPKVKRLSSGFGDSLLPTGFYPSKRSDMAVRFDSLQKKRSDSLF